MVAHARRADYCKFQNPVHPTLSYCNSFFAQMRPVNRTKHLDWLARGQMLQFPTLLANRIKQHGIVNAALSHSTLSSRRRGEPIPRSAAPAMLQQRAVRIASRTFAHRELDHMMPPRRSIIRREAFGDNLT